MRDTKRLPKYTRKSRLQLCWHCLSWQRPCLCWKGDACGMFVCRIHYPGEAAGWGFGIFQQVPNLSLNFGGICAAPSKLEKANWTRRTSSSSQLPGLGDPGLELPELLSRPAALSAWSSWKEEWDDVSAAEPTSNMLSLAAVCAWGRAQARSWMEMPLIVDLSWI